MTQGASRQGVFQSKNVPVCRADDGVSGVRGDNTLEPGAIETLKPVGSDGVTDTRYLVRHLFEKGKYDLSTALFNARCEVDGSENGQEFGDWLAPILIVQG